MSDLELRIVQALGFSDTLQQRTKDVWVDGSTTKGGTYTWSDWKDVYVVWHPKYRPKEGK